MYFCVIYIIELIWTIINFVSALSPPPLSPECRQKGFTRAPLILIALDGFHPDLLKKQGANLLNRIRSNGVSSVYMRPVYPTKTFPNLYTIVTGLYPESHGIVENHFKDPISNSEFFHTKQETYDKIRWGGEPIWITAKKNGIKFSVKHWPGDSINFDGIKAKDSSNQERTTYRKNINDIMSYMKMPENQRPGFITLYYNEPDHTMHRLGPNASQVNEMVGKVAESVYFLYDQMTKAGINKCVNVIIVSDHGMTSTQCSGLIFLNQIADLGHVSFLSGPSVMIQQFKSQFPPQQIYEKMRCYNKQDRLFDVYEKHKFPTRHHYSNNDRIGDVLVKVAEGHNMFRYSGRRPDCEKFLGGHGYDDGLRSMQSIFMAFGAHFKGNKQILPFQNIELYNLMTALLGIEPAPNNGTYGLLADALTIEHNPRDIKSLIKPINYYDFASSQKSAPDGGYFSADDEDLSIIKRNTRKIAKMSAQIEDLEGLDDYYNTASKDIKVLDPAYSSSTFPSSTNIPKTSPSSNNNNADLKILYDTNGDHMPPQGELGGSYTSEAPKFDKNQFNQGKCCPTQQSSNTGQKSQSSSPSPNIQPLLNTLVPFEIPKSIYVSTSILPEQNFITGYDDQNNYPLWVSYIGKNSFVKQKEGGCLNVDSRVSINSQMEYCQLPKDIRTKDGSIIFPLKLYSSGNDIGNTLTNVIYMYKDFYTNIWSETMKIFGDLAAKKSANVMIGPVFDENGDGLLDNNIARYEGNNILKPSHIFVMISYCKNRPGNQCEARDMTLNSFVIPHSKKPENCETTNEYFRKYYVRVKDIELLTGLKFFTKYPEPDRIKLITHYPLNLGK